MGDSFDNLTEIVVAPLHFPKQELRGSRLPLPANPSCFLNDVQSIALQSLENFGWQLVFIRHPLFVPSMVVLKKSEQKKFAVLEEDGSLNLSPLVKWRH